MHRDHQSSSALIAVLAAALVVVLGLIVYLASQQNPFGGPMPPHIALPGLFSAPTPDPPPLPHVIPAG